MKLASALDSSSDFEKLVDDWVVEQIRAGRADFSELVCSLPGVYPQAVVRSLKHLASIPSAQIILDSVTKQFVDSTNRSIGKDNGLPIPHPLDFDWRFSERTVWDLIGISLKLTTSRDTIALLGSPSIFYASENLDRQFVLVDNNTYYEGNDWFGNGVAFHWNLFDDFTPDLTAQLVLADPPWYFEHQRAFLLNAAEICTVGGHILLVSPKVGTRPGILQDWQSILALSQKLGLQYIGNAAHEVEYESPYFERNALKEVGIRNIPSNWRRADLAMFSKVKETRALPRWSWPEEEWSNEAILGIKLRKDGLFEKDFRNPLLISIVPNDVLPSVSRSDPRRKIADVWTRGNRIFACEGTNVLFRILRSIERKRSPYVEVRQMVGRSLRKTEHQLISRACQQIDQIISMEQEEIRRLYN